MTPWQARPLTVVVGAGGVGKTTLAAALGLRLAGQGHRTLVMTFDPSHRLKTALGVGEEAGAREVEVPHGKGTLYASLLDARRTFDGLVERYAPDEAARERIFENRFYRHLAGTLAGVLEYMAVERLYEVVEEERYDRLVLDTPPTRQALDFLEAPRRIVEFLDSGILGLALRPWFDSQGRLRPVVRWGPLGRRLEAYLDRVVGLDLLQEMVEFFQVFTPLYEGFRSRAWEVEDLLHSSRTEFLLVAGPEEKRLREPLSFLRRLQEGGYHIGPVVVNRVHPRGSTAGISQGDDSSPRVDGRRLLAWLGERDHRGLAALREVLPAPQVVVLLPLLPEEPGDLPSLEALGILFEERLRAGLEPSGRVVHQS